jgi:hypothetical protein
MMAIDCGGKPWRDKVGKAESLVADGVVYRHPADGFIARLVGFLQVRLILQCPAFVAPVASVVQVVQPLGISVPACAGWGN